MPTPNCQHKTKCDSCGENARSISCRLLVLLNRAKMKYVRGEIAPPPPPTANCILVVLSATPSALGASSPDGPGPDSSAQLWPAHALLGTAWDCFCVLPGMGRKKPKLKIKTDMQKKEKRKKNLKNIVQLIPFLQARVQIIILPATLYLGKQRRSESLTLSLAFPSALSVIDSVSSRGCDAVSCNATCKGRVAGKPAVSLITFWAPSVSQLNVRLCKDLAGINLEVFLFFKTPWEPHRHREFWPHSNCWFNILLTSFNNWRALAKLVGAPVLGVVLNYAWAMFVAMPSRSPAIYLPLRSAQAVWKRPVARIRRKATN